MIDIFIRRLSRLFKVPRTLPFEKGLFLLLPLGRLMLLTHQGG